MSVLHGGHDGEGGLCKFDSLNVSDFVACEIEQRRGVSPLRDRADRLQSRAPLRCLLVPMDPTSTFYKLLSIERQPLHRSVCIRGGRGTSPTDQRPGSGTGDTEGDDLSPGGDTYGIPSNDSARVLSSRSSEKPRPSGRGGKEVAPA